MENKLPEHIQKLIDQDAENYSRDKESEYSQRSVNAHRDGATAWAKQCQQMAEALKGILLFCETNGEPCDGYRFREEVQNARKLLTTWNEEKKPNKNTTNDTNK